jgi:hypothetical protein
MLVIGIAGAKVMNPKTLSAIKSSMTQVRHSGIGSMIDRNSNFRFGSRHMGVHNLAREAGREYH